jgi:hypothetical protein
MKNPINSLTKKAIAILICTLFSFSLIYGVSAQGTVMNAQASVTQPQVGSTLTVAIKISNVQNLAGIDSTLTWNPTVLALQSSSLNLGGNGVLHGTINYDNNNLKSGDLYVQETKVSGSYELVAQSIGASNPAYSGSGTIVTLTFNVQSAGSADLSLQTDLADHPASGQNANNIDHQDQADTVTTVTSGSSSPTTSPSATPVTPEYSTIAIIATLIALATATAVLTIKKRKIAFNDCSSETNLPVTA